MKSRVKELTAQNFPKNFDIPSVILLSRKSCHLCVNLKPIYDEISRKRKYNGIYDFYEVDAEEQELIYEQLKSDGVPTIYVVVGQQALEIPFPERAPESGYGKKDITSFLDKLME